MCSCSILEVAIPIHLPHLLTNLHSLDAVTLNLIALLDAADI